MASKPKILVFAGSQRTESFNKKLARLATEAAQAAGAEATFLDFRHYPMPLYDQDLEQREGLPESAKQFKEILRNHQGLIIASPEHNSSISALLKNAIDWASRQADPSEPGLACFAGKVAAIMSASPGALGGLRGLVHLRSILGNIQVLVLPDQLAIMKANEAFDGDGALKDTNQQASVERIAKKLVSTVAKLQA